MCRVSLCCAVCRVGALCREVWIVCRSARAQAWVWAHSNTRGEAVVKVCEVCDAGRCGAERSVSRSAMTKRHVTCMVLDEKSFFLTVHHRKKEL